MTSVNELTAGYFEVQRIVTPGVRVVSDDSVDDGSRRHVCRNLQRPHERRQVDGRQVTATHRDQQQHQPHMQSADNPTGIINNVTQQIIL